MRPVIVLLTVVFAMVMVSSAAAVFAQTTPMVPQVDQNHSAHHPDAKAQSKPTRA